MRHDDKVRKALGFYGDKELQEKYEANPFLYLGDLGNLEIPAKPLSRLELISDAEEFHSIFPFEDFVVYDSPTETMTVNSTISEENIPIISLTAQHVSNNQVLYMDMTFLVMPNSRPFPHGLRVTPVAKHDSSLNDEEEVAERISMVLLKAGHGMLRVDDGAYEEVFDYKVMSEPTDEVHFGKITQYLFSTFHIVLDLLIKARDKHLVHVHVDTSKITNKKKRRRAQKEEKKDMRNLPHYVYLDAPTYVRTNTSATGTGTPKRGHSRRGTWVHLRHDRFKHHPNFGGKIWRKPTWVGPTEWTIGNTIYTLKDLPQ